MNTDRMGGVALIAGAAGMVFTFALHPTGGHIQKISREASLTIAVHAVAIVSVLLVLFGFLRLARVNRTAGGWADGAVLTFAVASGAGSLAAVCNGFVLPAFAVAAFTGENANRDVGHMVLLYNHFLNTALSQVWITATCASLVCWSVGMLSARGRWSFLGAAGVLIGATTLASLLLGRLENNVHDVGLFAFATAAWTAVFGVAACGGRQIRRESADSSS